MIKSIIVLLAVCVCYAPAEARTLAGGKLRRYHTMEAYYAARRHHHHRSDSVADLPRRRTIPFGLGVGPVPYQYAVGNVTAVLDGSEYHQYDRFCQPLTLQYMQANLRRWQ